MSQPIGVAVRHPDLICTTLDGQRTLCGCRVLPDVVSGAEQARIAIDYGSGRPCSDCWPSCADS